MKILAIKPYDPGKYKDIFEIFCEGLEKYHNHEVVRVPVVSKKDKFFYWKKVDIKQFEKPDLIWASFEPLIDVAFLLKKFYDVPIVGHFETIPRYLNLDNLERYWDVNVEKHKLLEAKGYLYYKQLAENWLKCDIRTYTDEYEKYLIERLIGLKISNKNLFFQPYPFDNEYMEKYRDETIKEKNQIVSIFRLVNYKRAQHVIKALTLIDNPPKYIIIGDGHCKKVLMKMAEKLGVNVEFIGIVDDKTKAKLIQESMFTVHPWAWLPVGETSFFKKASIVYDYPDTHNKLRNMPVYTRNNDIPELAKTMKTLIDSKSKRVKAGEKAYKELSEGRTDILFQKEACNILNNIFKEAMK
jgi:hypothetical protein